MDSPAMHKNRKVAGTGSLGGEGRAVRPDLTVAVPGKQV